MVMNRLANGGDDTYETLDDGTMVPGAGWDETVFIDDIHDDFLDEAPDHPQTVIVTYNGLARIVVGALSMPLISNIMGTILGAAARHSRVLARILGMSQYTNLVQEQPYRSWFDLLWRPHEYVLPGAGHGFGQPSATDADVPAFYDDLDPVWYRNACGAALYIAMKDCFLLLYRYLKKQQRGKLHIRDLPFSKGVARELLQREAARENSS